MILLVLVYTVNELRFEEEHKELTICLLVVDNLHNEDVAFVRPRNPCCKSRGEHNFSFDILSAAVVEHATAEDRHGS